MELLWLAIVFYSAGLAAVLYLRPAVMFNENGTWKEFGYQRDSRHTLFPFWLFVITWAIVSYVLSMAVSSYLTASTTVATASVASVTATHSFAADMFDQEDDSESEGESDVEEVPEPPKKQSSRSGSGSGSRSRSGRTVTVTTSEPSKESSFGTPVSRVSSHEKPRPGYYVLDPDAASKPQGLRKYVYYGPTPPTD